MNSAGPPAVNIHCFAFFLFTQIKLRSGLLGTQGYLFSCLKCFCLGFLTSDLGLHCLLRAGSLNIYMYVNTRPSALYNLG